MWHEHQRTACPKQCAQKGVACFMGNERSENDIHDSLTVTLSSDDTRFDELAARPSALEMVNRNFTSEYQWSNYANSIRFVESFDGKKCYRSVACPWFCALAIVWAMMMIKPRHETLTRRTRRLTTRPIKAAKPSGTSTSCKNLRSGCSGCCVAFDFLVDYKFKS